MMNSYNYKRTITLLTAVATCCFMNVAIAGPLTNKLNTFQIEKAELDFTANKIKDEGNAKFAKLKILRGLPEAWAAAALKPVVGSGSFIGSPDSPFMSLRVKREATAQVQAISLEVRTALGIDPVGQRVCVYGQNDKAVAGLVRVPAKKVPLLLNSLGVAEESIKTKINYVGSLNGQPFRISEARLGKKMNRLIRYALDASKGRLTTVSLKLDIEAIVEKQEDTFLILETAAGRRLKLPVELEGVQSPEVLKSIVARWKIVGLKEAIPFEPTSGQIALLQAYLAGEKVQLTALERFVSYPTAYKAAKLPDYSIEVLGKSKEWFGKVEFSDEAQYTVSRAVGACDIEVRFTSNLKEVEVGGFKPATWNQVTEFLVVRLDKQSRLLGYFLPPECGKTDGQGIANEDFDNPDKRAKICRPVCRKVESKVKNAILLVSRTFGEEEVPSLAKSFKLFPCQDSCEVSQGYQRCVEDAAESSGYVNYLLAIERCEKRRPR